MRVSGGAAAADLARRGRKLVRLLADARFRGGLRHGVAATIEHEAALAGRGMASVVDIGANRGQFTLLCAGLYPVARIFAFEPLLEPYAVLAQVTAGRPHIQTYQAAIGSRAGSARMHVMRPDHSSSLLRPTYRQTTLFSRVGRNGTTMVRVTPLDALLDARDVASPALLKLDVQGFELEALKGCASLLDRFALVYVECSFERLYADQALASEVLAYLGEHGFELKGVYNMVCDGGGRAVQADFLCARH